MSTLFVDSVDHYVTSEIARKWNGPLKTGFVSVDSSDPRRVGSKHLKFTPTVGVARAGRLLGGTYETVVVGFALRVDNTLNADHRGFRLLRLTEVQCSVVVNSDGSISVRRGDYNGTVLGTSAASLISPDQWFYVEFKIVIHDSTGSFEVHVDESSILSGSGVDTKNLSDAGVDTVEFRGFYTGSINMSIDDVYIEDVDFFGDCRVDVLYPDGSGDYAQWTSDPSGDNYENVDDDGDMDDDTTHNATGVVDEKDSFTFDDLTSMPTADIHAVAVSIAARKDDAGAHNIKALCRIDSTDYVGSDMGIFDEYWIFQMIWNNPPSALSDDWTEDGINGAEFGVKITS